MLQFMGSQTVGHDLAPEQQPDVHWKKWGSRQTNLDKEKGKGGLGGQPELMEASRDRKKVLKVNGPRVTLAGSQREGASPGCSSL